jgi:pimeloyl-ACP methyl ester carboxylesterase
LSPPADPGIRPDAFEAAGGGPLLRGESAGNGPDIVLCHGLSATRRYVVHGSRVLPRRGYRLHTYDARGHGESRPAADGYGYPQLADDLERVIDTRKVTGPPVIGGHSMGCHTALAFALRDPARVSALVLIGPVYTPSQIGDEDLARWDERADALARGGPAEFGREAARGIKSSEYRETVERLARERAELHRYPDAVAEALRQVPRSRPFESMEQLAELEMPVLVVGTGDEADPGHPFAVAEQYAAALPDSSLVSEEPGESPLSWQGGRLSREIDAFLAGRVPGMQAD